MHIPPLARAGRGRGVICTGSAQTQRALPSSPWLPWQVDGSAPRSFAHSIGRWWQLKPCLATIASARRGRRRRGRDRLGTGGRLGRRRRTRGGRRIVWGRCTEGIGLGGHHRVRQVDPEGLVLLLALPAVEKGRPSYSMPLASEALRPHARATRNVESAHRPSLGKRGRGRHCTGAPFD